MKRLLLLSVILITGFSYGQVPNYVPTNGLVGWWGFNGNANDESGNGNNGTVNGATLSTDRFGNPNSAYDFDGVDDYIISPSDSRYLNDTLTISFWINLNTDPDLKEVICLGNSGSTRWGAIASVNYLDMNVGRGCSGCCSAFSISNNSNAWLHAVLVLTGGSTDIYKNGTLISTSTNSIPSSLGCNISDLYFGVDVFSSSYFLDLRLDDIGIWNRALTQCEISALYNAQTLSNPIVDLGGDTLSVCGTSTVLDATDNAISSYNWSTGESTSSITINSSGEYTVEVTDTNGCIGYDTTLVSIIDPTITASDTVICIGDSVTFSVTNTGSSVSCGTLPNGLEIGLLGYWPFCGNANDESGNGNNGNPLGPVLEEDRYGNTNSSYSFSSGSDLICTSNSFSSPNILTYSVWVNTTNPGQIVGFNNGQCSHGGTWDRVLRIIDATTLQFYTYSGTQVYNNAPVNVMDGEWHHLIVTLGSGGSNIYVDGSLISSNPSQNIGQGNTGYFRFGGLSPNDSNNSMIGTYDDIGIWNRVLTPSEIQELYELGNYDITWSTGDTTSSITVQPTQTTTYSVTVSDGISSCTDDVTITVNDPQVNLGPDQDVCQGDSVLLDAGAGYDYYSWNTGDTTQTIYASQGGSYDATVGYQTPVSNNYSLQFDGVDDYVSLPGFNVAAENINGRSTLIAQFNGFGPIFAGSVTTAPVNPIIFRIAVIDAGNGEAFIKTYHRSTSLSVNEEPVTPNFIYDGNTWRTIAVVIDNQLGTYSLYLDSQLLLDYTFSPSDFSDPGLDYAIGSTVYMGGGGLPFNGLIDNIMVWNDALSINQIQHYVNCPPTGNEAGLVGYWNFEEGSGTAAADQTSNGNDGTLVNGPTWSNDVPNQVCVSCTASDTVVINELLPTTSSIAETVCDSYTAPDGQIYTSTGNYTAVITNAVGCDSTITIDLTITNSNTGSETVTECDSYTWSTNGQTYTQTGQYTTVLTNQVGCDSTVTLNLTITNSNTGSETVTECDSYTWSTNGQTYTQTGQYTSVLTNQEGCDSTVILNLTITNSNTGSETVTECDSYTWSTNGQTYTQSGQYTSVLTNQDGCDSTVILNLTITNSNTGSETVTECDSYTWSTNGQTYTQSGQYTEVLPNQNGCDSTITLNLTIETVDITTQPVDQNVVVGNNAQFTVVTSASNPTYQWQMNDGTGWADLFNAGQYSGTDTDVLTISNVQLNQNNFMYRCVVTSGNCETISSVARLTIQDNVGLEDLTKQGFTVFPNPTTNSFTITSEKVINSTFRIMDGQGRAVSIGTMNGQEHTMDISKLSKGVYSVVFEQQDLPVLSVVKE